MQQPDKQSKLSLIRQLLSGSIDLEALRPPQTYIVFQSGEVYTVDGRVYDKAGFEQWKKTSVRSIDTIIPFVEDKRYSSEPEQDLKPVPAIEKPLPDEVPAKGIEAVKQPEMKPKKLFRKRRKKVSEPAEPDEPKMKNYGLLSEYGIAWKVCDRSLYQ